MRCPFCGAPESRVIDSRGLDEEVRRRRMCSACRARFTTSERIQNHALYVVKKDGRREAYDREKLATGIRKACEKRPLPMGSVERLITTVEERLHGLGRAEIPSSVVGDLVMEELEKVDHIAYIRFASVYREFADIGALKEALDSLTAGQTAHPSDSESTPAPHR